ncbi:MAG: hypothetical protein OXB97_08195 [Rhodospirillales bacterium]|nr:hypothetical protein [Rhodospirillales bacterium]
MQKEWIARRWTQAELDALMQCKVWSPRERTKRCKYQGEETDLQRFAAETGRSIKSVQRKWDTMMRAPARGGPDGADRSGPPHPRQCNGRS